MCCPVSQFNRNMRVLNLSGTGLTDASLAGLESFFKENCFLTSLDLAGNRFTQVRCGHGASNLNSLNRW